MLRFDWLKYGIFFVGLVFLVVGIALLFIPRPLILDVTANFLGVTESLVQIKERLITERVYGFLGIVSTLLGGIMLSFFKLISTFMRKVIYTVGHDLKFIFSKIMRVYVRMDLWEKILFYLIMALVITFRLYVLSRYELLVDEAFSYVYFVSKGFFVTATYYPGPNNHVLYNLICCFFNLFPISAYWVMKLPAFIFSIGVMAILFLYLRWKLGHFAAFAGLFLLVTQELFISYSLLGRGYMLMTFATLISLIALEQWKISRQRGFKTIFILANILGFYSVPVFLYPFASFFLIGTLYVFEKGAKDFFRDFTQGIAIILFTVIVLYFPVILFNGLSAIVSNPWVQSMTFVEFFNKFPGFIANFYSVVSGIPSSFAGIILFIGLAVLTRISNVPSTYFVLYIAPLLVITIQRVFPFDRVWVYYSVLNSCLIAFLMGGIKGNGVKVLSVSSLIVISITINFFVSSEKISGIAGTDQVCRKLIVNENGPVFTNIDSYQIFLKLASIEENKRVDLDISNFKSDTSYQLLVLSKSLPIPTLIPLGSYKVMMEDKFVKIYKLK